MAIGTDEDARFDYVVVGAGTAGCLLADRLSATGASVCVLEAGGRDWSPLIHLPVGYVWNVHSRRLTWDYAVEPGPVVNRRFRLPQGKVLGGSSSINGLSHVRGQRQDYDDWAAAGNPGWSYLEILPYFMRSERKVGVGDRSLIESLGVPLVADLPGVGQNLQDHYRVRLVSRLRYVVSINEVVLSPRLISEFVKWMRGRPNVLSLSASMAYTYWRSRPEVERPDLEFVFAPASFRGGVVGLLDGWPGMTLGIWQGRPESRGSVQARTASPFDAPRIQPNYLTDERDQRVLIDGIRLGRKMMSTSTLAPFVAQEEVPGDKYQTDEELLDFARETGATVYHVVGTCRMGPAYRRDSVVDHQLCVHGLQGLRVVDASIMPSLPSVNTNASTLMIAEKASDMILGLPPLHPADNLPGEDESLLANA